MIASVCGTISVATEMLVSDWCCVCSAVNSLRRERDDASQRQVDDAAALASAHTDLTATQRRFHEAQAALALVAGREHALVQEQRALLQQIDRLELDRVRVPRWMVWRCG